MALDRTIPGRPRSAASSTWTPITATRSSSSPTAACSCTWASATWTSTSSATTCASTASAGPCRPCRARLTLRADPSSSSQGNGDRQRRGADGRQKTAREADGQRPDQALDQQRRGDAEGERDLGERAEVERGERHAVAIRVGEPAAEDPAERREQQG